MKKITKFVAGLALATSLAMPSTSQDESALWADPVEIDAKFPPAMAEINFQSHGAKLNGHIYLANGAGPHPTVVLLHGFPGNEKNLDLAQALRRVGFNVMFFHYRGAWGSGGEFSFVNVVEDVASALTYLRNPETAAQYRIDPKRLSLVGHSMGGFAALMGGGNDKAVTCTVGIAAANIGYPDPRERPEGFWDGFASYTDTLTMLKTESGKAVIDEMLERASEMDTRTLAPQFSGRPVLLIAGEQDTVTAPAQTHIPVVQAYEAQGDIKLTHKIMQGDHSFSWTRFELTKTVSSWLETNCR